MYTHTHTPQRERDRETEREKETDRQADRKTEKDRRETVLDYGKLGFKTNHKYRHVFIYVILVYFCKHTKDLSP